MERMIIILCLDNNNGMMFNDRRQSQDRGFEVMEEQKVTVDGETHAVPQPFMVIATQNPIEQLGCRPQIRPLGRMPPAWPGSSRLNIKQVCTPELCSTSALFAPSVLALSSYKRCFI